MLILKVVGSLACILIAIMGIALSIPLIKGRIQMNPTYGIRIPKSFQSDENWHKINQYGARRLILWSTILLGLGVLLLFIPLNGVAAFVISVFLIIIFIAVIPIIEILRFAKKL